jgi:carboxyl-terminal processing protease
MIRRMSMFAAGLCFLFGQVAMMGSAVAEPRVALVIGNSHYGPEIGTLPNPVNDAGLMARALQQTGFQVVQVTDADQKKMKRAIAEFGDKLASAGPTATGLFFYAGHGVQVQGINYLVPIGADISKEADVDIEAVAADKVMDQMNFAGSRVNIIVLDACRNNPLTRSFRSVTRGLAPMNASQGAFVAYSTAPGSVANDGSGTDSPYSKALASIIVQPGMGIEDAFRTVRTQVMDATGGKQVPWDSSSLTAPFYFKPASAQVTTAPPPAAAARSTTQPAAAQFTTAGSVAAPAPSAGNAELENTFWNSINNSKQASDFQAYLAQFPNGTFAGLARSRLAAMGQGVPRAQPAVPAVPQPVAAPVPPVTAPAPVEEPASTSPAPAEDVIPDPVATQPSFCKHRDDTVTDWAVKCRFHGGGGGSGGGYGGSGGGTASGGGKW